MLRYEITNRLVNAVEVALRYVTRIVQTFRTWSRRRRRRRRRVDDFISLRREHVYPRATWAAMVDSGEGKTPAFLSQLLQLYQSQLCFFLR